MFMKCKVTVDTSHYPKEVPWELPRGWAWCHLSDLASFAGGKTPSMDNKDFWKNGKHLWITSKDMKSRYLIDSQMKISDTAVREMTVFHPGTILMVNRSGILRRTLPLAILNAEATINQDIKAIVPYLLCLSPYLYYAILSQESFILSEYKKAGTTVDNINFDKFISLLIPLPPQKEQDRIVSSVNQCFAIIENIDSSQKDLNISLDAAKAKILDLAIRGKLVPQDPNEEPAIELLMRINPDFRPSDNLHYEDDVPKGWQVCTLNDIFEITMGQSPDGNSLNKTNGVEFHQGKVFFTDKILAESKVFTSSPTKYASPNSMLCCVRAPVGVFNITPRKICIGRGLCALRPRSKEINLDYWFYALSCYKDYYESQATGTTFKAISGDVIRNTGVLLPPQHKQKAILNKIAELFAIIDQISDSID